MASLGQSKVAAVGWSHEPSREAKLGGMEPVCRGAGEDHDGADRSLSVTKGIVGTQDWTVWVGSTELPCGTIWRGYGPE